MNHIKNILGLAVAGMLSVGAAQAQEFNMTLAHVLSDKSPYQVTLNEFKRLIEERSAGRIAVDVQCCGQVGNETRMIQSWRTGIVQGGFTGGSSVETVVPAFRALSLPYLFESKQQSYEILQGEIGRELLAELEKFGMHGLGFGSNYERSVASNKPIETVEQMQGLKIRVLPTPGFVEAYNSLGTQPTPMAYGELLMAMQNKVVDALEISPDALVADRFHEVISSYSLLNVHQSTTIFVLSKTFWDSLPADLQEMVQSTANEAISHGIAEHDKLADAGLETAKAAGVTIIEPDLAPFMAEARKSWDVILKDQPEARAFADRIQALIAK